MQIITVLSSVNAQQQKQCSQDLMNTLFQIQKEQLLLTTKDNNERLIDLMNTHDELMAEYVLWKGILDLKDKASKATKDFLENHRDLFSNLTVEQYQQKRLLADKEINKAQAFKELLNNENNALKTFAKGKMPTDTMRVKAQIEYYCNKGSKKNSNLCKLYNNDIEKDDFIKSLSGFLQSWRIKYPDYDRREFKNTMESMSHILRDVDGHSKKLDFFERKLTDLSKLKEDLNKLKEDDPSYQKQKENIDSLSRNLNADVATYKYKLKTEKKLVSTSEKPKSHILEELNKIHDSIVTSINGNLDIDTIKEEEMVFAHKKAILQTIQENRPSWKDKSKALLKLNKEKMQKLEIRAKIQKNKLPRDFQSDCEEDKDNWSCLESYFQQSCSEDNEDDAKSCSSLKSLLSEYEKQSSLNTSSEEFFFEQQMLQALGELSDFEACSTIGQYDNFDVFIDSDEANTQLKQCLDSIDEFANSKLRSLEEKMQNLNDQISSLKNSQEYRYREQLKYLLLNNEKLQGCFSLNDKRQIQTQAYSLNCVDNFGEKSFKGYFDSSINTLTEDGEKILLYLDKDIKKHNHNRTKHQVYQNICHPNNLANSKDKGLTTTCSKLFPNVDNNSFSISGTSKTKPISDEKNKSSSSGFSYSTNTKGNNKNKKKLKNKDIRKSYEVLAGPQKAKDYNETIGFNAFAGLSNAIHYWGGTMQRSQQDLAYQNNMMGIYASTSLYRSYVRQNPFHYSGNLHTGFDNYWSENVGVNQYDPYAASTFQWANGSNIYYNPTSQTSLSLPEATTYYVN